MDWEHNVPKTRLARTAHLVLVAVGAGVAPRPTRVTKAPAPADGT